jgi:hypothetical protein
MAASRMPRVWHDSEAADVDHRQVFGRRLKEVAIVMILDELAPVGRRAASGRAWRRLKRFAQVREDLPDRPRLRDERDQSDVAFARWALQAGLLCDGRAGCPDARCLGLEKADSKAVVAVSWTVSVE